MKRAIHVLGLCLVLALAAVAQNPQQANTTLIQPTLALYATTPISATAAAGSQSTLTIPTVTPSMYNYVCYVSINSSNNNTGAVNTNVVTSTTNFNGFAMKWSKISGASNSYDWAMRFGEPATGCAKSVSPGTATTFVSPTSTDEAYTWYATYFQAP